MGLGVRMPCREALTAYSVRVEDASLRVQCIRTVILPVLIPSSSPALIDCILLHCRPVPKTLHSSPGFRAEGELGVASPFSTRSIYSFSLEVLPGDPASLACASLRSIWIRTHAAKPQWGTQGTHCERLPSALPESDRPSGGGRTMTGSRLNNTKENSGLRQRRAAVNASRLWRGRSGSQESTKRHTRVSHAPRLNQSIL